MKIIEGTIVTYSGFTPTNKNHIVIEVLGVENYVINNIKVGDNVVIQHDNEQKLNIAGIVRPDSESAKDGELLKSEAEEKGVSDGNYCLHSNVIMQDNTWGKKLTQTFNGNKQKQIDTILKILYAIRDDGQFYFFEYGKDLIERYLEDNMKDCKEEIKHMKVLIDNKNAFIENTEK